MLAKPWNMWPAVTAAAGSHWGLGCAETARFPFVSSTSSIISSSKPYLHPAGTGAPFSHNVPWGLVNNFFFICDGTV